ncbi:uncharacterized protein PAC_16768 [Phialocephala subalpina]|uniref:Uncharacterized protein n=1 Tax=Phialocephala subalpina TaxID=576137 RepID=A0A1L7XPG9_9HELO|nr:uncharacterized protein PAC_16768 [Phialocephala subalpina]
MFQDLSSFHKFNKKSKVTAESPDGLCENLCNLLKTEMKDEDEKKQAIEEVRALYVKLGFEQLKRMDDEFKRVEKSRGTAKSPEGGEMEESKGFGEGEEDLEVVEVRARTPRPYGRV